VLRILPNTSGPYIHTTAHTTTRTDRLACATRKHGNLRGMHLHQTGRGGQGHRIHSAQQLGSGRTAHRGHQRQQHSHTKGQLRQGSKLLQRRRPQHSQRQKAAGACLLQRHIKSERAAVSQSGSGRAAARPGGRGKGRLAAPTAHAGLAPRHIPAADKAWRAGRAASVGSCCALAACRDVGE